MRIASSSGCATCGHQDQNRGGDQQRDETLRHGTFEKSAVPVPGARSHERDVDDGSRARRHRVAGAARDGVDETACDDRGEDIEPEHDARVRPEERHRCRVRQVNPGGFWSQMSR